MSFEKRPFHKNDMVNLYYQTGGKLAEKEEIVMTSSEINKMLTVLEEQLIDLEDMNANRQFSKKE